MLQTLIDGHKVHGNRWEQLAQLVGGRCTQATIHAAASSAATERFRGTGRVLNPRVHILQD